MTEKYEVYKIADDHKTFKAFLAPIDGDTVGEPIELDDVTLEGGETLADLGNETPEVGRYDENGVQRPLSAWHPLYRDKRKAQAEKRARRIQLKKLQQAAARKTCKELGRDAEGEAAVTRDARIKGARTLLSILYGRNNGQRVTVGNRDYQVDSKGTYRRIPEGQ